MACAPATSLVGRTRLSSQSGNEVFIVDVHVQVTGRVCQPQGRVRGLGIGTASSCSTPLISLTPAMHNVAIGHVVFALLAVQRVGTGRVVLQEGSAAIQLRAGHGRECVSSLEDEFAERLHSTLTIGLCNGNMTRDFLVV